MYKVGDVYCETMDTALTEHCSSGEPIRKADGSLITPTEHAAFEDLAFGGQP